MLLYTAFNHLSRNSPRIANICNQPYNPRTSFTSWILLSRHLFRCAYLCFHRRYYTFMDPNLVTLHSSSVITTLWTHQYIVSKRYNI